MTAIRTLIAGLALALFTFSAHAGDAPKGSTVAVWGYDLVSYHQEGGPKRGTGNHVVVHDGKNYLFATEENADTFKADPEKYLPAYDGYCAYGIAMGHKVIADPTVYDIVDGKLYLNLNDRVQNMWNSDLMDLQKRAESEWSDMPKNDAGAD
ncbi:YHS domain-containing (seleno)protein [Yunchengibacter salinarum]|uniref:YHS domain-containing (seleno)protein n=1 Tax=Yunchengibacter salinarum TaxID=3133399 RepID=UPI0035B68504